MVSDPEAASASAEGLMSRVLEGIRGTAKVEVVYGESRTVGSKTIIPVAAVTYGFGVGAGGGSQPSRNGETSQTGSGGGGGGGVSVHPVALLEVTEDGTRVIPVIDWSGIIKATIAALLPLLAGRLLRRVFRR